MSENRPLTLVKGRQTQAALMRNSILRFLHYLWLTLTCFTVLIPILWMISASLTKGKLLSGVPLIPDFSKFSLEHYEYLFTYKSQSGAQYSDFVAAFLRSLQIAIVNTFTVVLFTTITGFVFSRFKFRGKKPILVSFLLLQMFPSFMGMIALFMIYRTFGWLNKPIMLVFIYAAGAIPYNTYLIRGYMRSIPLSIDEAAIIDGASKTQIFTKIVLPLSTPIIGFIAVNAFMAPWMDYMLPNKLLNMQNQTVAIFLYRLTDPMITLYYNPLNFMAGALVLATPITLVQFYMQRFIVYGMASGAEKG
ncbi:sugar ABC transporter permease [Gracilinema caldarium]|uniref:Maltose/maltodextrin transport system permease protein MalG n=1 Tax=Gracilinema caldarium (strain ATCC 51460 / DSM 7334 / H1) TaxID=744872 RepID=F8EYA0_GRAC1|nr:ABC transporter permease subunit [Gracilinema caldarium]AEJ18259.1 ABC-type transporter, integral membrane subunit [Gracilinema caldarium DSM 7334]